MQSKALRNQPAATLPPLPCAGWSENVDLLYARLLADIQQRITALSDADGRIPTRIFVTGHSRGTALVSVYGLHARGCSVFLPASDSDGCDSLTVWLPHVYASMGTCLLHKHQLPPFPYPCPHPVTVWHEQAVSNRYAVKHSQAAVTIDCAHRLYAGFLLCSKAAAGAGCWQPGHLQRSPRPQESDLPVHLWWAPCW